MAEDQADTARTHGTAGVSFSSDPRQPMPLSTPALLRGRLVGALALAALLALAAPAPRAQLVISGVIDADLPGGLPKAVELYATADVPDLSLYAIGVANNGGGTDGPEQTLAGALTAGEFYYLADDGTATNPGDQRFSAFFGFDADLYGNFGVNGDDAVELFYDASGAFAGGETVVDVFGERDVNGDFEAWDYTDGWAYRVDGTGPDGATFQVASFTYSGRSGLEDAQTNATARQPMPVGTYTAATSSPVARVQVIHNAADPAAAVVDVYVNGELTLDDLAFREATSFLPLAADTDLEVAVAPGTSTSVADALFSQVFNVPAGTYQLIASGVLTPDQFQANPDGRAIAFEILAAPGAQEMAADPATVGVRVVHGATDAPTVDVRTGGAVLVDDAAYTDVTGYLPVAPARYVLDVTTADGTPVASFEAELSGAAGAALTVLASGFLTPGDDQDGPAFGLLAVFADGTTALLPAVRDEPEPIACSVGSGLGFFVADGDPAFGFDTDGDGPNGEQVFIANQGTQPIDLAGCAFGAFDPFTEQVVFATAPFGSQVILPQTGIRQSTGAPWPADVLPDGPGALVIVDGAVAVGATVADVLPTLVAGLVYRSEDDILFNYNSQDQTATADFAAALARLSQPVASEDDASAVDLAVTAAPNPLRDRTTVAFGVAEAADVRVALYDALGRQVALLADAPFAIGRHELTLDARDLPAGVYVVRATVGAEAFSTRVTVSR